MCVRLCERGNKDVRICVGLCVSACVLGDCVSKKTGLIYRRDDRKKERKTEKPGERLPTHRN